MTRDRALAAIVLLIAGAILVLVFSRHSSTRTVVRTRTSPAVVIVQPPRTPLRDSIREPKRQPSLAKHGAAKRSLRSARSKTRETAQPLASRPVTRKRRVPSKKRKTAKTPQKSPQSGTAPYTAPQRQPPLVGVTVPVPVTVCAQPLLGVNNTC